MPPQKKQKKRKQSNTKNEKVEEKQIVPTKEYNRWLLYELKKRIFQPDSEDKIPKMYDFIQDNINTQFNPVYREYSAKYLKKYVWVDSICTIVTTFKLRDISDRGSNAIIYAFLYSLVYREPNGKKGKKLKLEHSYFCSGPSLLSRDGEYRQRLTKFNTLRAVMNKFPRLWNKLEEYILRKIKELPWNYYAEYFYPTIQQQELEANMITSINTERFPIKFLIVSWFTELFNIINDIPVNHTNKLYLSIMGFSNKKILKKDKQFYSDLKKDVGSQYDNGAKTRP